MFVYLLKTNITHNQAVRHMHALYAFPPLDGLRNLGAKKREGDVDTRYEGTPIATTVVRSNESNTV